MNIAIQISASLAILAESFMPFTANKLQNMLSLNKISWNDAGGIIIADNHKISTATHLFRKIEDKEIKEQIDKLNL